MQFRYYALACAVAAKADRRLADDLGAWWNELLDHLAGYTRPKAKLDKYDGRCALRYWVGLVIRRFLRRWEGHWFWLDGRAAGSRILRL